MLYPTLVVTVPIFLVTLLLVGKVLYSIFDPFMLTLFAVSASLGVMFQLSYANKLLDAGTAVVFVLSHLAFIAGLVLGNRSGVRFKWTSPPRTIFLKIPFIDTLLLVVLGLLLVCFGVMMKTVGLIIFQPDVVEARTTLLSGGYGILKRIIESGTVLAFTLLLVRNHYRPLQKLILWPALGALVVMAAVMGNKGFLFTFYAIYVYYIVFLNRNFRLRLRRRVRLTILVIITFVLVGAVANLMLTTVRGGSSQYDNLFYDSLVKLANRIAGFGDIGYLFFENNAYRILQKNVADYLGYISNDILGFFRLREYGVSPGAQIYAIVTNSDNPERFGPNAQVYFVGYMFFQLFGIVYSLLLGWLFAAIRRVVLLNFRTSNLDMLLFIMINYLITPMGMDLQLVLAQIFNMMLTMAPICMITFVVYAILNHKAPIVILRRATAHQ